jgi:hypothetical protein
MALGALSQAWISARAALPHDWAITGLVRDSDGGRAATAAGPADAATGHGADPVQALHQLTVALRQRPSPGDLATGGPTAMG